MKHKLALSLIAASAVLGGCATYVEQDPYYGYGYDYDAPVVRVAPPAAPYEYPGYPPAVGYVWTGGYWNWGGARYVWVPGRWEAPRPGYIWVPHRWESHGDHWRPYGGRWEPDRRSHMTPTPAPAPAPRPYQERHEYPRVAPAPVQAPAPVIAPAPALGPAPVPRAEPRMPVPERNPPPVYEKRVIRPVPDGMLQGVDPRYGREERRRPDGEDDRRHPRRDRDEPR